ncbi:hypothetical protein [Virgisporangium aurantiacum]|uniref:Uncharacterized protein n=1 Tax=Virgisporangium aurantiacum TaxID=175570 RepID=A0A8J3Z6S5_9ACTN|nr:hypothetical protein [Virgisporangium aurantiacum]GIJ55943.1 hypothetical protein Vau01_034590 [Virgisporangium aurantiacum]
MDGAVLPLWLSAIAALLTVGLAAVLSMVALRGQRSVVSQLRIIQDLYQRDAEQRARSQAQLVAAWPVSERSTYESLLRRGIVGAAVRNGSESPVYDVELIYRDAPAAWIAVRQLGTVPPAVAAEVFAGFDEERTEGTPDPSRVNEDGSIKLAPSAAMKVEIRFTDGLGVRWSRDSQGVLIELPPGTPPMSTTAPQAEVEPVQL